MSRTQEPSAPTTRPRGRARRHASEQRRDVEIIESGRRYSWGRRGDEYYIWDKRNPGDSLGHSWEANARREFGWLERQAQLRRRRRWSRLLVAVGLICVVAAPVAIMLYADATSSSTSEQAAPEVPATERHINAEGGYAFRVPTGWSVQSAASATEVTSPTGTATISIQVASEGELDAASVAFVGNLVATWTDAQTEEPQPRTVGELPAVSVGGTAVDESGRPLRFLSILVDTGTRNHAISVSVPESSDAVSFMPAIEEILSSFKPLEAP